MLLMFFPYPYRIVLIVFYFHLMDLNEILKIINVFINNQYYIKIYFIKFPIS